MPGRDASSWPWSYLPAGLPHGHPRDTRGELAMNMAALPIVYPLAGHNGSCAKVDKAAIEVVHPDSVPCTCGKETKTCGSLHSSSS